MFILYAYTLFLVCLISDVNLNILFAGPIGY